MPISVNSRAKTMLKKVLPPTYLLVAIILSLLLHFTFPVATIVQNPLNLIGLFPLMVGVALNLIADRDFKRNQTTVKPYEESGTLLTEGVYRYSRHPMYLGFVLILLGISLFLGSISPNVIVIIFAILMEIVFIRVEEEMLNETFQEEWRQYKSKVRKWI
ncbi:MAG: isoprenylcysteine carboxylmethyltransferase family protein [Anaerolineales bacterium]|nr:MAG: isoprenylcysteine carboxylmethyltransferase family protein [Anaerolineales bacterium]